MFQVIFHVDEFEKWELTLKNAKNFLLDEPESQIEVLANANAVLLYAEPINPLFATMKELAAKGVLFIACRNALKAEKIDETKLIGEIKVVPAGVVELAKKQMAGYAYIRP